MSKVLLVVAFIIFFSHYYSQADSISKGQAHLVYTDIPFSMQPMAVRVYYIIPETVAGLAIRKTQLALASIGATLKGNGRLYLPRNNPLFPSTIPSM
jgi:hypothetical protein